MTKINNPVTKRCARCGQPFVGGSDEAMCSEHSNTIPLYAVKIKSKCYDIKAASYNYYLGFVGARIVRGVCLANFMYPILLFLMVELSNIVNIPEQKKIFLYYFLAMLFFSFILMIFYVKIISGNYLLITIIKIITSLFIVLLTFNIFYAIYNFHGLTINLSSLERELDNLILSSLVFSIFAIIWASVIVSGMNAFLNFKETEYGIIFDKDKSIKERYGLHHFFNQPIIHHIGVLSMRQRILILLTFCALSVEAIAYNILLQSGEISRYIYFYLNNFINLFFIESPKIDFLSIFVFGVFVIFLIFRILGLISSRIMLLARKIIINQIKNNTIEEYINNSILILRAFNDDQGSLIGIDKTFFQSIFDISSNFSNLEDVIYRSISHMGPLVALANPERDKKMISESIYREYSCDDEWRNRIIKFMDESKLIIIMNNETESLAWEIGQICSNNKLLNKAIFIYPPKFNKNKEKFLFLLTDPLRVAIKEHCDTLNNIIGFRIINSSPVVLVCAPPVSDMVYYFSLLFLAKLEFLHES